MTMKQWGDKYTKLKPKVVDLELLNSCYFGNTITLNLSINYY